MEVGYLYLVGDGYMGSMQWQRGREMGTIPVKITTAQSVTSDAVRESCTRHWLVTKRRQNLSVSPVFNWLTIRSSGGFM